MSNSQMDYEITVAGADSFTALLAWYKFRTGPLVDAQDKLARLSVHDGVTLGEEGLTDAASRTSALFDGTSGYLSAPDQPDQDALKLASGTFVILVRVGIGALSARRGIISKDRKGAFPGDATLHYWADANELRWHVQDGTVQHVAGAAGVLSEGRRYALACSWGADGLKLYVDGVLRATNAYTGGIDANENPLFVGATGYTAAPATPANFWSGHLDHFQIYNTQLSDTQVAVLSPFAPAPSEYDAIAPLSPTLWLKLDESSGTLTDSSANKLAVSAKGSGLTYGHATSKGNGVRTNGTCHISVASSPVFGTDPNPSGAAWVTESEFAAGAQFIVPTLANDTVLMSMDDNPAAWANAWSLRVHANGQAEFRIRAPRYPQTVIKSLAGVVQAGVQFHAQVVGGRDGTMCLINGRRLDDGIRNGMHYWGLDHRWLKVRYFNASAFRLGATGTSGNSDLIVAQAFLIVRGSHANELTQANLEALAAGSGAPFPHHIWGLSSVTVSPGMNVLQAAIDARSTAGGGRVVLEAGTYTQSVDLNLKPNVEVLGAGMGSTLIQLTNQSRIQNVYPAMSSTTEPPGTIGPSTTTISQSNSYATGDCIALISNGLWAEDWTPRDTLSRTSEWLIIRARTSTTFTLDSRLLYTYSAGSYDGMGKFTPVKDIGLRGLSIHRTHNTTPAGNNEQNNRAVLDLRGVLRCRFSDIKVWEFGTGVCPRCFQPIACIEMWSDAEHPSIWGTDGSADTNGWWPYGFLPASCAGLVFHKDDIYSKAHHAIDIQDNSVTQRLGGTMAGTMKRVLNTNTTFIEVICWSAAETPSIGQGHRYPLHAHQGASHTRGLWPYFKQSGVVGPAGSHFEVIGLRDNPDGTKQGGLSFWYAARAPHLYDCVWARPANEWFNSGGAICRDGVFEDLTYASGSPTANATVINPTSYINVKLPNPRAV